MILIIANILSLMGNTLFTSSALLKSKKKILVFQNSNYILSTIAEILQKAYSATVQEMTAFFRNIVLLFVKEDKKKTKLVVSLIFLVIAVVVGVLLNIYLSDNIWYGYLPICATIVYSSFVIYTFVKTLDERVAEILIKIGLIFNSIFWLTYGFFIMLYPVIIFNCLTLVLSIITIVIRAKELKRERMEKLEKALD
jgi:hypothetical protein